MHYTLITGTTSGIGLALAEEFALHGHPLILVGRNASKLAAVCKDLRSRYPHIPILEIVLDLSDPHSAQALADKVSTLGVSVQYVINNAGIGFVGKYETIPFEQQLAMMNTNMITVSGILYAFIPMLKETNGGFLNVASTGSFQPGPYTANYYATKAYVLHLSQALRLELKKEGITVCALCPGATRSDFCRKAGKDQLKGSMSAQRVARIAYRQFLRKRSVIIPGVWNKITLLVPRGIRSRIIGIGQKRLSHS